VYRPSARWDGHVAKTAICLDHVRCSAVPDLRGEATESSLVTGVKRGWDCDVQNRACFELRIATEVDLDALNCACEDGV
jgi:hypothetical protein